MRKIALGMAVAASAIAAPAMARDGRAYIEADIGAVLDNPVVEVGGLPVAKSTVLWWESAGLLPAGTAANAPVIR